MVKTYIFTNFLPIVLWQFFILAKFYLANQSVVEIRKHDTDFYVNVHYYWLLLLILLKRYTNADLKNCCHIYQHVKNMPMVSHFNNFYFLREGPL